LPPKRKNSPSTSSPKSKNAVLIVPELMNMPVFLPSSSHAAESMHNPLALQQMQQHNESAKPMIRNQEKQAGKQALV
jgi:hypothetical protein